MSLSIIGPNFLEKVRSSDYKNSTYAIAEIIDNSIDANADNIELITITENGSVTDIYFIDDGDGMSLDILQRCVVFSETNNPPGGKKTGVFGMGLPNSSISQCTRFSISTQIDTYWYKNEVDFELMKAQGNLDVNDIFEVADGEIESVINRSFIESPRTIVHWTELDRMDFVYASTLNTRAEKLLGRIHRYAIRSGLTIRFLNYSDNNEEPDINTVYVENDPLFLTKGPSWIAPMINELAVNRNSDDERLSQHTYFSKFICEDNTNIVRPLFYEPEHTTNKIEVAWGEKTYCIDLTLAVAYKDIQKPGLRNGGRTKFGQEASKKVKGTPNYPSGNISWVRNDREITCGNYSMFNITSENERFWSIELNYKTSKTKDNVLDTLLGLSNSKQGIKFTPDTDLPDDTGRNVGVNLKRQELIAQVTLAIQKAIDQAKKILLKQAREWQLFEDSINGKNGGGRIPGPTQKTYTVLLDALGRGEQLSEPQRKELSDQLKRYLPTINLSDIKEAVNKYSQIGLKNLIIYCELDDRDLFQTDSYQGKNLTLINISHPFYSRIIEPLREKNENDLLASIELLISSMSRVGENHFFNEEKENIKEFYELTSKDIKKLLNTQSTVVESD